MIEIIFKSYFSLIASIVLGAVLLLMIGFYLIARQVKSKSSEAKAILQEKNSNVIPVIFNKNINVMAEKIEKAPVVESNKSVRSSSFIITSNDITAIAGDDVIATQLDLARAYIETGRKQLAKKILEYVLAQGSVTQKNEAEKLLGLI
jgi:FimV-like protein